MNSPKCPCLLLLALLAMTLSGPSSARGSQLASTPPMGWNTWNQFGCKVTDAIVRAQADAMVKTGMKAAGYTYVNIDDCWEGKRDPQGFIRGNDRFPDMKALADYVHSKGLKIGIYSSPDAITCEHYEGSLGHEEQDAQTYANWGFDFLKYDWCYTKGNELELVKKMSDAIRKTGRPMVFSLSGNTRVWRWGASIGANMWRTTDDMRNNFYIMVGKGLSEAGLEKYAGPGHWNDPDMLEIGNTIGVETSNQAQAQLPPDLLIPNGMNEGQWRVQMGLWAILAAPLIATCDLTHVSPQSLDILTNHEVTAVDQDSAGIQGYRVSKEGPLEVWMKPLSDGSKAVGLFAFEDAGVPISICVNFRDIGLGRTAQVRDLWAKKDLGSFQDQFTATVPVPGVVMLRIK